jgi:hypothetical protein
MGWTGRFAAAVCVGVFAAGVARAEEVASPDRPTDREIRRAVDAYLGDDRADVSLVGGPGDAGYDGSFWVRAGSTTLRTGLVFQTRWEGFDWDDTDVEASPGGDLSGFSLPRVTWWLGGEADCGIAWYAELEFGHALPRSGASLTPRLTGDDARAGFMGSVDTDEVVREAWIGWRPWRSFRYGPADGEEYGFSRWGLAAGTLSMGLVRTAGPWQLMVPPEEQQFIDVSLASAFIGMQMPGFTDRNRDFGIRWEPFRATFGRHAIDSVFTVTNGEGPSMRNVLDQLSDDHVGFSGRLDWSFSSFGRPLIHTETAVRQREGEWNVGAGLWAYTLHHASLQDRFLWGVDAHAAWGGLTGNAGYQYVRFDDSDVVEDLHSHSWNIQVGYLFPGTAVEVAGRATRFQEEFGGGSEYGFGVNYYLNGPSNRLSLDVTWIRAEDEGNFLGSPYPGFNPTFDADAALVRLQWQIIP